MAFMYTTGHQLVAIGLFEGTHLLQIEHHLSKQLFSFASRSLNHKELKTCQHHTLPTY